MARLRVERAATVEITDDSDFMLDQAPGRTANNAAASTRMNPRTSPRKKVPKSYCLPEESSDLEGEIPVRLVPKTTPKRAQTGRQIPLRPLSGSLLSKPLPQPLFRPSDTSQRQRKTKGHSPKQALTKTAEDRTSVLNAQPQTCDGEVEVEESVWCGSDGSSEDSDEELPSPRKFMPPSRKPLGQASNTPISQPGENFHPRSNPFVPSVGDSDSDSILPKRPLGRPNNLATHSRPASSSDKENTGAFLRFSPPRLHSIPTTSTIERPITPPQSPSKSRLHSPSKTRTRIPTPPLRQSLDAFWNADTVNDWNEQYSPKKILKSPRKLKFIQDESSQSPTSSPRKPQSPSKRTKADLEAKKSFTHAKHQIAQAFLSELDWAVTQNQIRDLAASTGGVHIIWSKTLNTTAGRANWRKETTKTRQLDGSIQVTYKHHASIELAEKVIDDEHRLLNVIAHEFCHLANFMISGIKDQPHGKQFKVWGRKTTEAFTARGVEVTTKHSYRVEYKFVWQCSNKSCGAEFGRHSKSIDPTRKVCGSCKGRLVQVKPTPRKEGEGGRGYAKFVKEHFGDVKRGMPGASQGEVMEAVARRYRAEKERKAGMAEENVVEVDAKKTDDELRKLTSAVEVITLDDD